MGITLKANADNPLRAWLAEFALIRGLFHGPSGRPLYTYQVTAEEYENLRDILTEHCDKAFDYRYEHGWAACFCLYVAECFRREYDAGEKGWAWSIFEDQLGCDFTPQQRAELVTNGLDAYWRRPIRSTEKGRRDWLGSLFAEGGLPWLLVQSDSHGFGRSIRKGLKDYYQARRSGRTIADVLSEVEQYLPQAFRNLETRQLLAGIVEQLMDLVERHPLREQDDPAAYLDERSPRWRYGFPLPLDEKNARGLINEWLKDAGRRRQERKEEEEKASIFTCEHRLLGGVSKWSIQTDVIIPRSTVIPLEDYVLHSTRMEVYFYEGEQLLAKAGVVYGKLEGNNLSVRFPTTQVSLRRHAPQEPLTLRLFENGVQFCVFHFSFSALDYAESPLIFEECDDEWQFISTASCSVTSNRVRVHLPSQFHIVSETGFEILANDEHGRWVEATESLRLQGQQELITVRVNQPPSLISRLELKGNQWQHLSQPATVYIGWPSLGRPSDADPSLDMLTEYANGNPVSPDYMRSVAGRIRYSLRNAEGETVLRRRFGVLPKGFQLDLAPAVTNRPARLKIYPPNLKVSVNNTDLRSQMSIEDESVHVLLQPVGDEIPATISVSIFGQECYDPILLKLPFPYQGARLIGVDGSVLKTSELALDGLLGLQIALSSGLNYNKRFTIYMELVGSTHRRIGRSYYVDVGRTPVLLSLFGLQNDMAQMLGAVNEQDAFIRLTVETQRRLLTLNIRRYNGQVRWLQGSSFEIVNNSLDAFQHGVKASAMLLSDPRRAPVPIAERKSEGVGVGVFEINATMQREAPWLIYPEQDSVIKFRPAIYTTHEVDLLGELEAEATRKEIHSLHEAARLYDPKSQPLIFDEQITAMATDFGHSGWQYLADLKMNYAHLPLSTFESWRALVRNPHALSVAVFRLEIDEAFCGRIRDELAVIWECIPLPLWSSTYRLFNEWLVIQGIPEVLQVQVVESRFNVLLAIVSGFEEVVEYLKTGDTEKLKKVPVEHILPTWYQDLRRTHEANDNWPNDLNEVLSSWVQKQNLPSSIKDLSQTRYSGSVAYLPIFMAYVTAGKATLDELGQDTTYLKFAIRMISDFDRTNWYVCAHAMMVSYLLARTEQDEE